PPGVLGGGGGGPPAAAGGPAAVDTVILATGYAEEPPAFLAPLLDELPRHDDGTFRVRADFRLDTDTGPGGVWVQNAARHSHGLADPNLSLSAWRSAVILNSLGGREVFRTDGFDTTFTFGPDGSPPPALREPTPPTLAEGTFLP
ncbi:hypothetical protein AB8B12_28225, partial [Streptomyces sp. PGLac3x]